MSLKSHGITNETINNIMLNAGVFYKNLTYANGDWTGTVVGATSGGGTINIEPEYLDVEVDGATVAVKGLTKQKVGETATMEMNLRELTEGVVVKALNLVEDGVVVGGCNRFVACVEKFMLFQENLGILDVIGFRGLLQSHR